MEFYNSLKDETFRATNSLWNELRLNDPWSVGYVSLLIESQPFASPQIWEEFYYNSGEERNQKVERRTPDQVILLNDFQLKYEQPKLFESLSWDLKNLNYLYGRTQKQLAEKGNILFEQALKRKIKVTLEECIESVRYRTIGETWNGIALREKNTIQALQQKFTQINFVKTDPTFDHRFAVDYEMFIEEQQIGALQIKPPSYLGHAPYIEKAKKANQQKNRAYHQTFNTPVFDIISQTSGEIINTEIIKTIEDLIQLYE